jgi:hypothetical protein
MELIQQSLLQIIPLKKVGDLLLKLTPLANNLAEK